MERQSAISAFFRPVDKRIRDSDTENESYVRSGSSIDSSTSDQALTSRNVIASTDQISEESGNNIPTLPMPCDINTLPNELPTREGCNL